MPPQSTNGIAGPWKRHVIEPDGPIYRVYTILAHGRLPIYYSRTPEEAIAYCAAIEELETALGLPS